MNKAENKRGGFGLKNKLLASIVMVTVVMCLVSCLIGYIQYDHTIKMLYNENGYVIGEIILEEIDHDKIAQYASTWEKDAYYDEMASYLKNVESASGAAYIYMIVPTENETMRYIYDSSGISIGGYDDVSAYYDDLVYIYGSGERTKNEYYVRHSKKYGYLTSSILPVKDSGGRTVALLFVDVYMKLIVSTLVGYIVRVMLISAALLVVFCVISWQFMKKSVIRPIDIIVKNVHDFAQSDAQLTDTLGQVKTGDELQNLAETIYSMECAIVQYISHIERVTAEKERIGAELNVATQIQANMLPCIFPAFPDRKEFDIYASMTPAKEVGGDFYDFYLLDDDHLAMVMADVSGKGVPAALFMVISKTLLKDHARSCGSPAKILEKVNNLLYESNAEGMFVTVWLGIMEISTGRIVASNAGHEIPALRNLDGNFELVRNKHGMMIGVMPGITFKEYEMQLEHGSTLFVYTDGVPEATNAQNELFNTERMIDALNINPAAEPERLLANVKDKVDEFVGEAPQFDDLTMLAIVRK